MAGNSWYGFTHYPLGNPGKIKTILHGCGRARLDYGECGPMAPIGFGYKQTTSVYLNGIRINEDIDSHDLSRIIDFDFKDGDILELRQPMDLIYIMCPYIRFNSFTVLSCCKK